ncbi:MAG TPA: hypothetical protein VEC60_11400 [Reyranella sp.]|nr:hypothetical protein [Reyranella sp.]
MRKFAAAATALAASTMVASAPAQAQACWNANAVNAAKVRNLDIMLMVTALRCRMGPDNFQPDYYKFSAAHQAELNVANGVIRAQFAGGGPKAANRALDKMSVVIANGYGTGHPNLGCKELRRITRDLAGSRVPGNLLAAADALVVDPVVPGRACGNPLAPPTRVAAARR